jgi:hypothetical protein
MEEWQVIPGFPNHRISNHGRVLSTKYKNTIRDKLLKPVSDADGYHIVCLWHNGKKNFKIHRLVALMFIPNPENKLTVNHIDGDKTNNHVSNLEWMTNAEQNFHKLNVLKNKNVFLE